MLTVAAAAESVPLEDLLDLAAELHVTEPWRESDAVLDQIKPRLDQASDDQRAQYLIMRSRNRGLGGDLQEALDKIPDILTLDIAANRRLRAIGLGANLAMLSHQYELAFDYLNQGLALVPEADDPLRIALLYNQASHMHTGIGDLHRARTYGERAKEMAIEAGDARTHCTAAYRLAYVDKTASQYEHAESAYRKALGLCRDASEPVFVAASLYGMADTLRRMGEHDEADRYFSQAYQAHQDNYYIGGLAETRLFWAYLRFSQERIEEAKALIEDLELDLTRLENWELLADYHELRSRIARREGEYQQALSHQDARYEARERFLDHDRALQVAYQEIAFDSRVKEQELALLREQARFAELQEQSRRQQQRMRHIGYVAGVIVLGLLILLLAYALRERHHYRQLSVIDSLTGLFNHTRFFDAARPLVYEAGQQGQPLTLVLADIDYFKEVNDCYGHLVGDDVLRKIARCFRDALIDHGPVGRIGGEEFAACLPDRNLDQSLALVKSLRRMLTECDLSEIDDPITLSFGIAELLPGEKLQSLRKRADEALYRAKHEGRDRIIVAGSQPA